MCMKYEKDREGSPGKRPAPISPTPITATRAGPILVARPWAFLTPHCSPEENTIIKEPTMRKFETCIIALGPKPSSLMYCVRWL